MNASTPARGPRRLRQQPLVLLGGVVGNLGTPLAFIIGLSLRLNLWHNPEEVQQILVGLAPVAAMPINNRVSLMFGLGMNNNGAGLVVAFRDFSLLRALRNSSDSHAVGLA